MARWKARIEFLLSVI